MARSERLAWAAGIAVLVLWVFYPAIHGQWLWDDGMYVAGSPDLRSLSGMARARSNLGNAYFMSGRPQEAVREYRIALQADPNDRMTQQNLEAVLNSPPP